MAMFYLFGEEFSRLSRLLPLTLKLKWAMGTEIEMGDGRSTRFWLDHWVSSNTLAIKFPNLFGLALDPSIMVDSQLCLIDGHVIWAS